jgi:peptide/nickel transport system permease protein
MLLTRNAMLETLREDYVLAARAKGLPANAIRDRHVARNALLPVVTSLVFSVAFAFDGGVITETIFSWPGIGLTLISSSIEGDLPLAVGAFLFTGMFALIAHMAADVLYVFLDPRIRYQ